MQISIVSSLPVLILLLVLGSHTQAQSTTALPEQDRAMSDWRGSQSLHGEMQAQVVNLPDSDSASHSERANHLLHDSYQLPISLPPSQGSHSDQVVTALSNHSLNVDTNRPSEVIQCAAYGCDDCAGDDRRYKVLDNIVSFWEKLDVNGHVRVRHETDFERINRPTRNRDRLRARLGFTNTWNDEIKAGIRWTTGDRKFVLEPGDRSGSPLSYQDTGDVFDKFEFNLDRIFVTYTPYWLPDSFITVGKFAPTWKLNPIFSDPVGDLVWDEAAQPEGVAAGGTRKDFLGFDQFHTTIGESAVLELGNQDDASFFFVQLWGEKKLTTRWKVAPSFTWYNWSNLNPDGDTRISTENNAGNSVTQVGIDTTQIGETSPGGTPVIDGRPLFVFDSGFNIVNPMIVMTYDDGDECSGVEPIQFVYEAFHNEDSFDAQRAFGYSLGTQYGPAITRPSRKQYDWKVYYSWNEVEQESVFTPVAQDDFQLATNFRGHWVGLDFYPWDDVELRFWLLSSKPLEPITVGGVTSDETQWRFRADITAYF